MNLPFTTAPPLDQSAETFSNPGASASEAGDAQSESLHALIARQPFFKGLNTGQLQLLTESALEMKFEAGETVFKEGSPANRFYIILQGKVVLESEMADRNMIPVQMLGPGDDLGWSWLFPPYSFHLSARAKAPTKTIFFYGTRLREQCEQDHELGYQIMKRIAEVATQSLRATQQRLMEYIDRHSHQ